MFQNVLCLDFFISSSFLLFTYKKPVSEVREQVGCGRELGSLDQSLESGNKVLFEKNRLCKEVVLSDRDFEVRFINEAEKSSPGFVTWCQKYSTELKTF